MIWLNFQISNPWWKGKNDKPMVDYVCVDKMVTKHKFVELQISKMNPHELFEFTLDTCWFGEDHAGFELTVEVYGFYFSLQFRDNRHWNYKENRWVTDAEAQAEYEEWQRTLKSKDGKPDEDYFDKP